MSIEGEGHLGAGIPQDVQPASAEGLSEIATPDEFGRIRENILKQWRQLPLDEQTSVLQELGHIHEQRLFNSRVHQAFDAVIEELRSNKRANHQPTTLESILEIFRSRLDQSVEAKDFFPLFDVSYSQKQAVRNSISRLNRKLNSHNVRIICAGEYRVVVFEEEM